MSSVTTTKATAAAPRVSPISLVALAGLVAGTNWGCIVLGRQDSAMASIWVANAIVLASLLKNSRRAWPEILGVAFVSYFSADLAVGNSVMASTCIALANIVEVLAVALPLRWLGFDRVFSRTEVLITFYAMVAVACVLSAALAHVPR